MFAKEYRRAGHTAKFIGFDPHTAYCGLVTDARVWDELEGMLIVRASGGWWNEDDVSINLTRRLLHENHANSADEIIREGSPYVIVENLNRMLEIIKDAVETVGPQNFDSQALFKAAQRFAITYEGIDGFATFGPSKRTAYNYMAIYEVDATEEDIFRVEPGVWHRIVETP